MRCRAWSDRANRASKSAFDVWLRSVAAEVARDGATTTSIYLPLVHTRMSHQHAVTGAPTDFSRVPGLTVGEAADLICHAVTARPREIAPWWSAPVQAWTDLTRTHAQRFMERAFRR